jgi:hypothetical protein
MLGEATFPDSVWSAYFEQQTDVTGCVDYAGGQLVRENTCACGSRESVAGELQRFLRQFPDSPVAARVRRRIAALRNSAAGMRFNCQSG